MTDVASVIIAAGSSSRLGRPKQLVLFEGEKLLERAIRVALESGAKPVLVVLGANQAEIEAADDLSGVQIVVNGNWPEGMASSIRAGVAQLQTEQLQTDSSGADGVLLMVCDQPSVTSEHIDRMLDAFRRSATSTVASSYAGKRGIPAVFPRKAFVELLALEGDKGARGLLAEPGREVIEIPLAGGEQDIDHADDLFRIKGM